MKILQLIPAPGWCHETESGPPRDVVAFALIHFDGDDQPEVLPMVAQNGAIGPVEGGYLRGPNSL